MRHRRFARGIAEHGAFSSPISIFGSREPIGRGFVGEGVKSHPMEN
jgi:hypothetical protein